MSGIATSGHALAIGPDRVRHAACRIEGDAVVATALAERPHNAATADARSLGPAALAETFASLLGPGRPASVAVALSDFLGGACIVPLQPAAAAGGDLARHVADALARETGRALSDLDWDFRLFRAEGGLSAFVHHAPRRLVAAILSACASLGVAVSAVEPESSAALRLLFGRIDGLARRNILHLDVGPVRTLALALAGGEPVLHRMLEGGYAHFAPGGRPLDLLPAGLSAADPAAAAGAPLASLGAAFRTLAEEIDRTARGVRIHRGARRFFDHVHLAGALAADADFGVIVEELAGAPLLPPPTVRVEAEGAPDPRPFLGALGAALGMEA